MFSSIFSGSSYVSTISISQYMLCMAAALLIGAGIAWGYTIKNEYSKSFVVTIAMLPAIVASIIIMVNGNLGAGVAVAGTFGLVRFRSAQGSAKEICAVFLSMAVGLSLGMGFIGYAVILAVIISLISVLYNISGFGIQKPDVLRKKLTIMIPEELDYTRIFDDLMESYTDECELTGVKTANMGSMYKLTYEVKLKNAEKEKEFIDKLRCRNGNLEIVCARMDLRAGSTGM